MKSRILISVFTVLVVARALPHSFRQNSDLVTRQDDLEAITDTLLFSDTIDEFLDARAAQDPPELNWYSNGCSLSPDHPLGNNFLPSCQRHDFGYHNYKAQDRFTSDNKARIDSNFKNDMYNECDTHGAVSAKVCRGTADVYYEAVSVFGGLSGSGSGSGSADEGVAATSS